MDLRKYRENDNSTFQELTKKVLPIVLDYNEVFKKLTKEEKKVRVIYKGDSRIFNKLLLDNYLTTNIDSYEILEKILNHGKTIDLQTILYYYYSQVCNNIEILDKVINKYKLKKEITVYRGMYNCSVLEKLKIGETFKFKNYLSTSLDINVALGFSGDCILELKLPARTNVCYLNWDIDNLKNLLNQNIQSSEFEILLGRDYVFKLTKITHIKAKYIKKTWKNLKNGKNRVGKIPVYHLTFKKENTKTKMMPFERFSRDTHNIDFNGLINIIGLKNIYYKRKNRFGNSNNNTRENKIKN